MSALVKALCFLFACFLFITGGSAVEFNDDHFCPPVFTTIGRHYTPRISCARDPVETRFRQLEFIQHYMEELGCDDQRKNEELADILNDLSEADAQSFETTSLKCTACSSGFKLIRYMFSINYTNKEIKEISEKLCIQLNLMYPNMCKAMVQLYGDALCEIVRKSPHNSESFCAVLFNGVCYPYAADRFPWNVQLPQKPKPPLLKLKENPNKPRIKVLHISDTHWDVGYTTGTPDECRGAICCRKDSVALPNRTGKSGKWGGWMCDLPESTFDSFIEQLQKQHSDVNFIIWTGDIPAHDIWDQNVRNNHEILKKTVEKLRKAFPKIPIYPALGNHESIPPNLYPEKNQTEEDPLLWLYSALNKEWHHWLPGNHTLTIMRGGFYSVLVKPKLRVISMNMNYCYTMNWWLLVNGVDPEKELKWLVDELLKAEEAGEKVHIIGHVPSGYNECTKGWQTNFYKIINRFENTVAGQFFGHTHTDEIELFYDMKDKSRPFGIAYLAPSVTTYTYLNPGYRLYYIDGDYEGSTRYVLDHETYIMDLEKANEKGHARWTKSYSAREAYNMTSLFPEDWNKVYQKMIKDDKVMDLYYTHYWKNSPKRPPCDEQCKLDRLCDIRSCVQYGKPNL